jgi:hypothetical protein
MAWPLRHGGGERCDACRAAPVQCVVTEDAEEDEPGYRVCRACEPRLLTCSLRPLEWYNLAVRYGPWRALLHDDMYGEDGTAEQPKAEVVDPHLFPAPTLDDVRGDVERLVDFALTRYTIESGLQAALAAHDADEVLQALDRRIDGALRADARELALEICAAALGVRAEAWVRRQWSPGATPSEALLHASACCLPPGEGFDRAVAAIVAQPPGRRLWLSLRWFRSEKTLDLIEQYVERPATGDWGMLAADSCLSWERAARWLDLGRPLSLVALDGLYRCIARRTPYVHGQPPELAGPMPVDEMIERLEAYARADPQHRPETTVKAIVELLQHARHEAGTE